MARSARNNDLLHWGPELENYKKSLISSGRKMSAMIQRETKDLAITAEGIMARRITQVTSEGKTGATASSLTFEFHKTQTAYCISIGPTTIYAGWLDDGTSGRTKGIPVRDKAGNPTAFLLWVVRISGLKVNPNPGGGKGRGGKLKPRENVTKRFNVNATKRRTSRAKSRRRKYAQKQGFRWADDLAFVLSRSIAEKGTEPRNYVAYTEKAMRKYIKRTGNRLIDGVQRRLSTK